MPVYNPTGPRAGYVTPTRRSRGPRLPRGPGVEQEAGTGWGGSAPWTSDTGWGTSAGGTHFGLAPGERGVAGGGAGDWIWGNPGQGGAVGTPGPLNVPGLGAGPPGGAGSVNVMGGGLDYEGILSGFQNDWRSRINAQIAAGEQQRLSQARGLINRLGVRDPAAMAAKLAKFGITSENLQAAADNPFSDLKALQQQADRSRASGYASQRARGAVRSGGTQARMEMIENERARSEAQMDQEALQQLDLGLYNQAQNTQDMWEQFNQRSFDLRNQLAQMYQPREMTADWDPAAGAYRAPNGWLYNANRERIG